MMFIPKFITTRLVVRKSLGRGRQALYCTPAVPCFIRVVPKGIKFQGPVEKIGQFIQKLFQKWRWTRSTGCLSLLPGEVSAIYSNINWNSSEIHNQQQLVSQLTSEERHWWHWTEPFWHYYVTNLNISLNPKPAYILWVCKIFCTTNVLIPYLLLTSQRILYMAHGSLSPQFIPEERVQMRWSVCGRSIQICLTWFPCVVARPVPVFTSRAGAKWLIGSYEFRRGHWLIWDWDKR
jgi:hypothetical protein